MRRSAKLSILTRKLLREDTKNNDAIYKGTIHAEQEIYTITGGGGFRRIRSVIPETRMARSLKNAKH